MKERKSWKRVVSDCIQAALLGLTEQAMNILLKQAI
jgi:hypothetical protein